MLNPADQLFLRNIVQ